MSPRINLSDLFDPLDLEQAVKSRHVKAQVHPTLDLVIYNYTDECTFSRSWTDVTRQCRGLICDNEGWVLARPFPKFFNHGEPGAPAIYPHDAVTVTDKLDGSLGILYPTGDGGHAIATRGSFASEQAQHATALWQEKYADRFDPSPALTYLFEIIYRDNRIVCDYGDMDDLVLLGAVNTSTGISFAPETVYWPGPRTETFNYQTFADAIAAPPRPGKEGLVVRRHGTEDRLKIKQADYVRLHRILTGVTARHLWEGLAVTDCWDRAQPRPGSSEGHVGYLVRRLKTDPKRIQEIHDVGDLWLDEYLTGVPEEFRDWVTTRVAGLTQAAFEARVRVLRAYYDLCGELEVSSHDDPLTGEARKRFVELARERYGRDHFQLMSLMDGKEIRTWAWRECYPGPESPFKTVTESNA